LVLDALPHDRQIFPTPTVRRTLELGLKRPGRCERWTFADMPGRLPLRERRHSVATVRLETSKC